MQKYVDLHSHTIASDGELTGEELVNLAIEKSLSAIAVTDHDSFASVKSALEFSKGKNIEIISGIEISCDDPLFDYEKIDIIGLFTDISNRKVQKIVRHINDKRDSNKKKIIGKLAKMGYDITYEDVKKDVKGTFGRPHIAKYLLKKYPDKFVSVRDVFDRLIGKDKEAFVWTKDRVSIIDAIEAIRDANGLSILPHPGIYKKDHSLTLIDFFAENEGDGIETYYPYHIICPEYCLDENGNQNMIDFYKKAAKSKGLLESGGNDHHGNYRPTIGLVKIPYKIVEKLKKALKL